MNRRSLTCCLAFLLAALALPPDAASDPDRALILDYELYPADFANELIRRVATTGLEVEHRQYYPHLTASDVDRYAMIVLLSSAGGIGSNLQLPEEEIPALVEYVSSGGLLVLGIPSDPEAFHQLDPYNRLLEELDSGIRILPAIADDDSGRYLSTMFPQAFFVTGPGTFAANGVDRDLVLDRGTLLDVEAPGVVLARTSPAAYPLVGLGRPRRDDLPPNPDGYPLVAMAQSGRGWVLVTGRFTLNIGGFNGRIGVGPVTTLDWIMSSDRFIRNLLDGMVRFRRGHEDWPYGAGTPEPATGARERLAEAPPSNTRVRTIPPGGSLDPQPADRTAFRREYRAAIRRDVFGRYLDEGVRSAWGEAHRDDEWLREMARGFGEAGFNYIWGVGWPERFVSDQYPADDRASLRRAWETYAEALEAAGVDWTIGVNFPGAGFDADRYAKSRGVDGRELDLLSPLDVRYWHEHMIPALEEVARFSLTHRAVKGVTVDYEMYGYEPIIFYPEAIGFEEVSYEAFLRAAKGHVPDDLLAEAAALPFDRRYPWLRDRGLLDMFYLLLELESEKLGRLIRERLHAINPDFVIGAYQAGLPYSWFYRGLIRGLSTPAMPMIWLSFQGLSAEDMDRWWLDGRHMLNAAALMLGTYPIDEYKNVMLAGRLYHDGYWINRYNWLIDDGEGRESIEIPQGPRASAWAALAEGNRRLTEHGRIRHVPVRVRMQTELGSFDVEVDAARAPVTAVNFLRYVDEGYYDGGRVHRTVTLDNQPDNPVKIEVIQGSVNPDRAEERFGPIPQERTRWTGLAHRDGVISMARTAPDSAVSDFFICIGDQPSLDFGGDRNPDGRGFAAFGRVVSGMDVVRRIQIAPADGQRLDPPVRILRAWRLAP